MPQSRGGTDAPERPPHAAGPALGGPPLPVPLPDRDMRRKRPPALSFLLRMDTLQRVSRVVSLLALDFAGIFAAILTALCLKAAARDAWDFQASLQQTKDLVSFAFLSPRCCSRARGCTRTAASARALRGSSPRCSRSPS